MNIPPTGTLRAMVPIRVERIERGRVLLRVPGGDAVWARVGDDVHFGLTFEVCPATVEMFPATSALEPPARPGLLPPMT